MYGSSAPTQMYKPNGSASDIASGYIVMKIIIAMTSKFASGKLVLSLEWGATHDRFATRAQLFVHIGLIFTV